MAYSGKDERKAEELVEKFAEAFFRHDTRMMTHVIEALTDCDPGLQTSMRIPIGPQGDTILHAAARVQPDDEADHMIRLLAENGANLYARNALGETALHAAAGANNIQTSLRLIHYGSNVTAEDGQGNTPLAIAKKNAFKEEADMITEFMPKPVAEPAPVAAARPVKSTP